MAITVPTDCHQQPTEQEGKTEAGVLTHTYVIKGPYTALKTYMAGISPGDNIDDGYKAKTAMLQRNPGDYGTLSIVAEKNPDSIDATAGQSIAESEVWELKSVRNDVPLLAYCGESSSEPQRAVIEAWQQEPDGNLAKENSYKTSSGETVVISDAPTLAVIEKLKRGISAVMRFYPMVTVTRVYSSAPTEVYSNLATINTPAGGPVKVDGEGANARERREKPAGIAAVVSAHSWLKCQDDVKKGDDGKWTRTQSWMGCLASEGGWDGNLYGTANRWPMPYTTGGNGST